jgi:hypothetical protein
MLKGHRFLGLRLFRFVMLWPRKVNRNRLAGFSLPHPEKSAYRKLAILLNSGEPLSDQTNHG